MSGPQLRDDPQATTEGWCMDLYCKYTVGFPHDHDAWGVTFCQKVRMETAPRRDSYLSHLRQAMIQGENND